jgi:hypothetical protein
MDDAAAMQRRKPGRSNLEVADIGFGCVPDADRVEISDRKHETHSPAERDHVSFIEERLHPFLRDSPLEFGEGIFVGREEFVPNCGRGGGIDHLERPLGFVLKADDGNFDRNAVPLHGP